MILYPAIDLKGGHCVRLHQGSFEHVTTYAQDPIDVALIYEAEGATHLHVVDLDGAKTGEPVHGEVIQQLLKKTTLKIQIGGGIRDINHVKTLLDLGVERVVIGSLAIKKSALVKEWIAVVGNDAITLALDVRLNAEKIPMLTTDGWQNKSSLSLWELLDQYKDVSLKHILCTDIDRDGTLQGAHFELYAQCMERYPNYQFQASGGIPSLEDLITLKERDLSGAIIGKALYEKKFSLPEALEIR